MTDMPPPPPGAPMGQPGGGPTSDERTWAMLAHILGIPFGFLAGLIILLAKGKESAFVKEQATEALNFQISLAIAWIVSFILIIVLIGILLIFVVGIGGLILMIMAGVAANRGEHYRYPINIRMVKS